MAVINEIQNRDSSIASTSNSKEDTSLKENMSTEEDKSQKETDTSSPSKTTRENEEGSTVQSKESENILKLMSTEGNDSDDEEDESLMERIIGLSEMLPDSVCEKTAFIFNKLVSFTKKSYSLSRQVTWVVVSTSLVLFAPVMIQVEKFNVEEMMKQDRDRLLLGPRSTGLTGPLPTSPGMPPAPSR